MSEPNVYELSDSESDDDDDMFLVNQDAQSFSVDENSDYSDDEDVSLVTDSTDANDDDEDMDDIEENQPMLLEPQKDCSSLFPDLLQISAASNFKPPNTFVRRIKRQHNTTEFLTKREIQELLHSIREKNQIQSTSFAVDTQSIDSKIVGRKEQIDSITRHLNSVEPCVIYLYGVAGTGKSFLVRELLSRTSQRQHAYINCTVRNSPRELFESTLNQLTALPSNKSWKCVSFSQFLPVMKAICSGYETAHLVMDDVEKLRSFHKNFLNSLLKLPESMNLCIILIGRKDWDSSMAHLCPGAMPFHVYFSSYNKEELLKIIMKDFVAENQVLVQQCIKQVLELTSTRNLSEMKDIIRFIYPKYKEPVDKGEVAASDTSTLYKKILPLIKKNLIGKISLKEVSSEKSRAHSEADDPSSVTSVNADFSLMTKYIIVACYLAAHNPPSTDQRYFGRKETKLRKGVHPKKKSQYLAPKAFGLARMLAITQVISSTRLKHSVQLYSKIEELVAWKLLSRVTQGVTQGDVKYKTNFSPKFAMDVAKSIPLDVSRFMHDE